MPLHHSEGAQSGWNSFTIRVEKSIIVNYQFIDFYPTLKRHRPPTLTRMLNSTNSPLSNLGFMLNLDLLGQWKLTRQSVECGLIHRVLIRYNWRENANSRPSGLGNRLTAVTSRIQIVARACWWSLKMSKQLSMSAWIFLYHNTYGLFSQRASAWLR